MKPLEGFDPVHESQFYATRTVTVQVTFMTEIIVVPDIGQENPEVLLLEGIVFDGADVTDTLFVVLQFLDVLYTCGFVSTFSHKVPSRSELPIDL
jgi:hypothetical protein